MIDCLIITSGNENTPSTRIRILDIFPRFKRLKYRVVLQRNRSFLSLPFLVLTSRAIIFQKRFPPLWSVHFLLFIGKKIFFDVDDAVYLNYEHKKRLSLERFVARCTAIFVGNEYLKKHFLQFNLRVYVIPTGIDSIKPKVQVQEAKVIVGWIGTSANFKYLEELNDIFKKLTENFGSRLEIIIVSDKPPKFRDNFNYEFRTWSLAVERKTLEVLNIGLMPLDINSEWVRGKCAFKMLLYMSHSIATVSSNVGANAEIISSQRNGILVETQSEWFESLSLLIENADLRNEIASNGWKMSQEHYLKENIAMKLEDVLQKHI